MRGWDKTWQDRMPEHTLSKEFDDVAHAAIAEGALDVPHLLVIDDDDLHRTIICRAAAKAGYFPVPATGFDDAIRMTRERNFACITLDISLGAHVGAELLRELSTMACKTPIIIVSGCDDLMCRETAKLAKLLGLNVADAIPKPVDLAVLRAALERILVQRAAMAAPP